MLVINCSPRRAWLKALRVSTECSWIFGRRLGHNKCNRLCCSVSCSWLFHSYLHIHVPVSKTQGRQTDYTPIVCAPLLQPSTCNMLSGHVSPSFTERTSYRGSELFQSIKFICDLFKLFLSFSFQEWGWFRSPYDDSVVSSSKAIAKKVFFTQWCQVYGLQMIIFISVQT